MRLEEAKMYAQNVVRWYLRGCLTQAEVWEESLLAGIYLAIRRWRLTLAERVADRASFDALNIDPFTGEIN